MYEHDLALNNLPELIWHKNQPTDQPTNQRLLQSCALLEVLYWCIYKIKYLNKVYLSISFSLQSYQWSLEYSDRIIWRKFLPSPCQKKKKIKKIKITGCPGNDNTLHFMVRLMFWRSRECRVPHHCHYFQVHSEREW